MRRSAHRLALTGVDSQITEALLQAFSASELQVARPSLAALHADT